MKLHYPVIALSQVVCSCRSINTGTQSHSGRGRPVLTAQQLLSSTVYCLSSTHAWGWLHITTCTASHHKSAVLNVRSPASGSKYASTCITEFAVFTCTGLLSSCTPCFQYLLSGPVSITLEFFSSSTQSIQTVKPWHIPSWANSIFVSPKQECIGSEKLKSMRECTLLNFLV
uniref:Uncharacterized protein n=1 Tax=Arundo donax TaxID=35708 RepID=A0A0A9EUL4_ARUDO